MSISNLEEEEESIVQRENFHYIKCFKGHKSSVSCVLYFDQEKRVVTSSFDEKIRIWNYKTGKCIKILKENRDCINHLMKWDVEEGTFLSCTDRGELMEFSVITKKFISKIGRRGGSFLKLLKINSKHFVVADEDYNVLTVVDYKTGKEVVTVNGGELESNVCLVLSKRFKNSFYFNINISRGSKRYQIQLLSLVIYKGESEIYRHAPKLKMKKEFFLNNNVEISIGTIDIFTQPDGREILVVGCDGGILYFFDTSLQSRSSYFRRMDCSRDVNKGIDFKCCVTFQIKETRFGLFGADDGIMILYNFDIFKTVGDNVANSKHRNNDVVDIKLISISHHIVMITASGDWTSKVFSINIPTKKDDSDLVERVTEYVKTEFLEVRDEEEGDNEYFSVFKIQILPFNNDLLTYKSFLL